MPSEPIHFVTAVWVKAQSFVRYSRFVQHDLWGAPTPRSYQAEWLSNVTPSLTPQAVKEMLSVETGVPVGAIALVEVADA